MQASFRPAICQTSFNRASINTPQRISIDLNVRFLQTETTDASHSEDASQKTCFRCSKNMATTTGWQRADMKAKNATAILVLCAALVLLTLPDQTDAAVQVTRIATPRLASNSLAENPLYPLKEKIDTLVLCPAKLQGELARWVTYRKSQDFKIEVVTPGRSAHEVRQQILESAKSNDLKNIVIVGDAGDRNTASDMRVPTDFVMARDNVRYGSEIEIATDNRYADIDDDGTPDVAIGRMPVDSPAELKNYIDRVIRYERDGLPAEAMRRVNFVAGVGGFGKIVDGVIEETTKQIITDLMPGEIETTMTYGSWTSPYCPDPRRFSESTFERFNEGSLFWVYIGHGARRRLDRIYMPDQMHDIITSKNVDKIECRNGCPIAIFLACYTNAVDAEDDCLGELMLKQEHGPIACIGGTRVTKPAAMGLLSLEMIHDYFYEETETLGEIFLHAKQRMVHGSKNFREYRQMIEGLAKSFSPGGSFRIEKEEHVHLLHLLGDPLLKLPRPDSIDFGSQQDATAGETLVISGKSPKSGTMTLELAYRRDRLRKRFRRRRMYDSSDASFEDYQKVYDQSRDLVAKRVSVEVNQGLFSTKLEIPEDVSGACVIRAYIDAEDGVAIGSTPIQIKKPKPK